MSALGSEFIRVRLKQDNFAVTFSLLWSDPILVAYHDTFYFRLVVNKIALNRLDGLKELGNIYK